MQATAAVAPAESNPNPVDALAAARFNRTAAAAALETARAALHRGKEVTLQRQQGLARYDDLEQRISEASAENIRSGGTRPIPAKLEQEYNERRTEQERFNLTVAGLAVLERDVASAEQALREAQVAVTLAAVDAMLKEGGAIAEQIGTHYREALHLEQQLQGLDTMVSSLAHPLPADVKARLAVQLRKLREALMQPKRHPVPWGLQADHNRRVMQPWVERFNELTK